MSLSKRLFIEEAAGGWDVSGLSLSSSIDAEAQGYLSTSGDAGMAFDINADGNRIAIWGYTEGLDYGFGDISTSWDLSTITNYSKQNTGNVSYRVPQGVRWSNNGNNFYVHQSQYSSYASNLRQWELGTSFGSVTYGGQTRTFTTGKNRGGEIYMSKDGSKMIISEQNQSGGTIAYYYTYSLSTAYNVSTATQTSSFTAASATYGNYAFAFDVNEDFGQIYIRDANGYLRYNTITNLEVNTITRDSNYDLNHGYTNGSFRISPDSTKCILADGNILRIFT